MPRRRNRTFTVRLPAAPSRLAMLRCFVGLLEMQITKGQGKTISQHAMLERRA